MNPPTGSARRASGAAPGTPPGTVAELGRAAGLSSQAGRRSRLRHDAVARGVLRACVAGDGELLASLLRPDVMAVFDAAARCGRRPGRSTAVGSSPRAC
ncbi:hypothetical protein ABT052_31225 [Streptomyces sp. NPDC002766]|uniref:hypothetical protein n=1 Tax=Streptomyces sp. NPDC002766 TaxID=3154429 RepID=UPI00332D9817